MDLEEVREWNIENSVYLINKEDDINTKKCITKIHKILNHKKIEQIKYA